MLNKIGYVLVFFRDGVRNINFVFYLVSIFFKFQFFYVLWIVGMIVDGCYGVELVEFFDQYIFCVEVGKFKRVLNVFYFFGFILFFYGLQKFGRYFKVVDEVDLIEMDIFFVLGGVGMVIDNICDVFYDFFVFISQKVFGFIEFECCIFFFIECIQYVVVEVRYGIRIFFV